MGGVGTVWKYIDFSEDKFRPGDWVTITYSNGNRRIGKVINRSRILFDGRYRVQLAEAQFSNTLIATGNEFIELTLSQDECARVIQESDMELLYRRGTSPVLGEIVW